MTKQELKDKFIKLLFDKEEEVELKFVDVKKEDGTILNVEAEELAEGAKVFVVSEDGEKSEAPEGEHVLEDGSKIVVEGGVIASITEAETTEEVEEEEMASDEEEEEMAEDDKEVEDKLKEDEKEIEMLKEKLKEMEEKLSKFEEDNKEEKFSKLEEDFNDLKEASKLMYEMFEKLPGSDKIESKKTGYFSTIKDRNLSDKDKKREAIMKTLRGDQ